MALKPARSQAAALPGRTQAGVSLIELVVAFSLSSLVVGMGMALYKDVGIAARLVRGGSADALQTRVFFNSLSDNLMGGGGLLSLEPGRLRLLNQRGQKVEYAWEDSAVSVNGKPWGFKLASLEVQPFGPALPKGEEWTRERMELAEADSLDEDRDGVIDMDELDRDRSGDLDPLECRYVARVTLKLETVREGTVTTHQGTVHPRNHARDWTEDALDALPGVGDFGR